MELTDAIRKEIDKGLVPKGARVGDMFPISTGDHIRITGVFDNDKINYTLVGGPIQAKETVDKALRTKGVSSEIISKNVNKVFTNVNKVNTNVFTVDSKKELNKEVIMADDLVTRNELIKRDIDAMKKELESEIAVGRNVDLEIKGKVQELDSKVCVGEECYARIEKKQDDMLKFLTDQLKSLSEPRFVCKKCHSSSIRKGDKACPVCGDAVGVVWV